jgi:DNA-binding MarR family transcriptional regulator
MSSARVPDGRRRDRTPRASRRRVAQAPPTTRAARTRSTAVDYATLAELRYYIRRLLRTRELAARALGVEPQQYQLLLQVKGLADGRPVTIARLADRLQLRHHTVVELVDRLVDRGLLSRARTPSDRRAVALTLRPAAETVVKKLSTDALAEIRTEGPELIRAVQKLIGRPARARRLRG